LKKRKVNISCPILLFTIFHDYFCGMYLYLSPILAAAIGWMFNWVFIRYLIGKVIPSKASAIAAATGRYISEQVISVNVISDKLTDPAKLQELRPVIESHIDNFLNQKLKEKMPAIAMFVGEKTIEMMKKSLMEEIDLLLPELLRKYIDNLTDNLNIGKMLTAEIDKLPDGRIEELLYTHSRKERLLFQLWGALVGLVIGVILILWVDLGR
jgi:uncharacterized membrane protein YheB (UPF0754 family)